MIAGNEATGELSRLTAIAQADLIDFRRRTPRHKALFSSARLLVFSDRFMCRFGGALALYRWTCLSPVVLSAPADVRRAVIAHEWGHAASGHCLATMATLLMALGYGLSTSLLTPSWPVAAANIGLLVVMGAVVLWTLHPNREFEADAVAARLVGSAQMANGLRWAIDQMREGKMTDTHRERLARLDANAV